MQDQLEAKELSIPVQRVTGETVEDRLTETVLNHTLPERYLNKDEDGNVVEEPAEMFERVAKNLAVAEVVHESNKLGIEVWVTPDQIKPNHPRRGELAAEVFGFDGRTFESLEEVPDDLEDAEPDLLDETVELTEKNASKFAYDTLVPELENEDLKDHVVGIKNEFEDLLKHLDWMPNSPALMNAGDELQQLAACFVMSPDDDIDNIYDTSRKAANTFQSGGGVGYAFWRLRPYGDVVGSTGGIASGPITFMRSFDGMCETIAQGGTRRGAQMGVMRVTHPDVIQFIHSKNKDVSLAHTLRLNDPDDFTHSSFIEALDEARGLIDEDGNVPRHLRNAAEGHLSNFNISVGVTSKFMQAVKNDEDYELINPRTGEPHIATEETKELYERFDLSDYVEVGEELTLPAREVWDRIADGAHENGEPGILMLDRANEQHAFPVESSPGPEHDEHEILASNPCGEQFLEEYEACNLGHINLSTSVAEEPGYKNSIYELEGITSKPTARDFREWHSQECAQGYDGPRDDPEHIKKFLDQALNWEDLNRRIDLGLRFLENVCTMSDFPVPKIEETVRKNRKVGLGIMGLAQMFVQLGLKYGEPAANEVTKQLMIYINRRAKTKSHELAVEQERGSFENHDDSKYANPVEYKEWFEHQTGEKAEDWEDGYPIRNYNVTTIAPTGTTSQIGRTSGGCEPIFSVVNFRSSSDDIHDGELYVEMDDYFKEVLEANGIDSGEVKEEATEQMNNEEYNGIQGLSTVPDALSELFITTKDLTAKQHAQVQCAAQKGVDSSISKTINAPSDATLEETKEVLMYVYDHGGKGVTYYRDGSRSKQVKTTRKQNTEFSDLDEENAAEVILEQIRETFDESIFDFLSDESVQEEINGDVKKIINLIDEEKLPGGYALTRARPKTLHSATTKISTGYGEIFINITYDDNGDPFETFINTGKSGGLFASDSEAIGKVVSVALRSGVPPEEIIDVLENIRAPKRGWDEGEQIESIPDAVATALKRFQRGELFDEEPQQQQQLDTIVDNAENGKSPESDGNAQENEERVSPVEHGESPKCPSCGEDALYYSEGCKTCDDCGWSEC
ncbi:adenosylcobalamin-dependent ribonucleoside-diphosphate reductase [Halosimplex pelagicum]|uniref:Vitamin B12-dependent ribonucleotide reductase n=1 Tax=Halosimplex pelagicum TaxID=869886 RepID=A0A7D5TBC4_9EURY|nr:adenosylcobalamin-dependent ribonucleoside-diphosphate reductase [Halosimplex pelagicum]QLH82153.1 adenosylcobalamin-dependent ribonucleoside-diphosphate reductase [Halosimplex pelagicum]